jgi:hypothetical protein
VRARAARAAQLRRRTLQSRRGCSNRRSCAPLRRWRTCAPLEDWRPLPRAADAWARIRFSDCRTPSDRGQRRGLGRLRAAATRLETWPPPLGSAWSPDFDERRFLCGNAAAISGGGPPNRRRDRLRLACASAVVGSTPGSGSSSSANVGAASRGTSGIAVEAGAASAGSVGGAGFSTGESGGSAATADVSDDGGSPIAAASGVAPSSWPVASSAERGG